MSNILWLGNKSIHNITHHQYWYSNHVQELANSKSSTYLFPEIPAVGRPLQHHPCPICHHRQSPRFHYNRSPLFPHHCSDHQPNEHHHLCSWHQWLKIKIQITQWTFPVISQIYAPDKTICVLQLKPSKCTDDDHRIVCQIFLASAHYQHPVVVYTP